MTDARTDIPPSGPAHHRGPIVGLGEVLWDLLPTAAVCGGAPANCASQIAVLGGRAVMVTAVGTDDLGNLAVATLLRHGVDCQHAQRDAAHPTGTVTVSLSATGDASYTFAPDTAWDHIAWNEALANLAAATAAVCFGTLGQRSPTARTTIRRFVESTPTTALRVFDVTLRQSFYTPALIHESLAMSSVLKLNEDELPVVAAACGVDVRDPVVALRSLSDRYALRLVALTRGSSGSILVLGENVSRRPAEATTIVDTVGAGDAFTAALVLGLLEGKPLEAIHDAATRLAALTCAHPGAVPAATLAS